ncbi:MAG: hypothetical protein WCP39_05710 [Chlamydiota bacterium]
MKWFAIFFSMITSIFGALPITHLFLAEKWVEINENYDESEKKAFYLGNLYPDIRYIGVSTREKTHIPHLTIEDIKHTKDPFEKGVKLHSFIDDQRAIFIKNEKIVDVFEGVPKETQYMFLRLLEDEILFGQLSSVKPSSYFSIVQKYEINDTITEDHVRVWHTLLSKYFQCKPSSLLKKLSFFRQSYLGISSETVQKWNVLLPIWVKDNQIKNHVDALEEYFLFLFQQ